MTITTDPPVFPVPGDGHLRIKVLSRADLPSADALRSLAGWNQPLQDWERFLQLEPEGCFGAEWDGGLVGTATTTCYGPQLAWIGMMLVHPEHRRLGVGSALLQQCIRHLRQVRGVRCIKLDATPLGQPVYEKHGFTAEMALTRWQRPGSSALPELETHAVRSIGSETFDSMVELDAAAFGCRRRALLEACLRDSVDVIHAPAKDNATAGFGMVRPGARARYLGPLAARNPDVAARIAQRLLARLGDRPVFWDVFDSNRPAVELAKDLGFTPQRSLVRMFLGENCGPGQTGLQWGIVGPATG